MPDNEDQIPAGFTHRVVCVLPEGVVGEGNGFVAISPEYFDKFPLGTTLVVKLASHLSDGQNQS